MTQSPMELLAELREAVRKLQSRLDAILDANGNVRSTSVAATPLHGHSGGGQGGPLKQGKVEDYVDLKEQGVTPGTPGSSYVRLYAKTDGRVYSKDDAGSESGPL